jgi:diguanylate cyclase (GGDEF)-like protein
MDGQRRRTGAFTKRSLIALSRALEEAAVRAGGDDVVILALFQHADYFLPQVRRYGRFARGARAVLVACAGTCDPPPGVTAVDLAPDDPLVEEWALVVLGPQLGLTLVARDLHEVQPSTRSYEEGRLFSARWSALREHAVAEALRILHGLGDDVPAAIAAEVRRIVGAATAAPATPAEQALHAAVDELVLHLEGTHRALERSDSSLAEARLIAETDVLTGLRNRAFLERYLDEARRAPSPGRFGVVLVDLDGFKAINDTLGHTIGDTAIRLTGRALVDALRVGDVVVRWGGDEFLVLLPGLPEAARARRADALIRAVQSARLPAPHGAVRLGASAGFGLVDARQDPLAAVDAALYAAKAAGGGRAEPMSAPAARSAVDAGVSAATACRGG